MTMDREDDSSDATDLSLDGDVGFVDELTAFPADEFGPVVLHGIDVVSIDRIASLLQEFGESFRSRVFTESEQTYCEGRGSPPQHYAARWAAKEAFCKTLDDESPAILSTSIEVSRQKTGPSLVLEPPASKALTVTLERKNKGVDAADIAVSLSHDQVTGYAVGSVTVFGIETQDTNETFQ